MAYNSNEIYLFLGFKRINTRTSNLVKELCKSIGISVSELSRKLGQTPQNFNKKLQRETLTTDELLQIGNVLGVRFEQSYTLNSGEKITISNDKSIR